MKQWWLNRNPREQQLLIGLMIFLFIFISYHFLWAPYQQQKQAQINKLHYQQQLLQWMQQKHHEFQALSTQSQHKKALTQSPAATLAEALKQENLYSYIDGLEQNSENRVVLRFNQVPFDRFIQFLEHLSRQYAISIEQLNISQTESPGFTSLNLQIRWH